MTLHRLQLFVSIAKHLNITRASEELRISQPAVSQQIKLLQEEFGISLLNKQGRNIRLTDDGKVFLKTALSIISQLDGLKRKSVDHTALPFVHSLSLGGSHTPSAVLLPSLLAKFLRKHPKVHLTLRTGTSREIQDLILTAKASIGIITSPIASPSLHIEPYRVERICAFVPAGHRLSQNRIVTSSELATLPLIIRTNRQNQSRTEELLPTLDAVTACIRCESPEAIKTMVRNGAGVGLAYETLIEEEVRRGEFEVLKLDGIDLSTITYLVYPRVAPLSETAQVCLEFLRRSRDESFSVQVEKRNF